MCCRVLWQDREDLQLRHTIHREFAVENDESFFMHWSGAQQILKLLPVLTVDRVLDVAAFEFVFESAVHDNYVIEVL